MNRLDITITTKIKFNNEIIVNKHKNVKEFKMNDNYIHLKLNDNSRVVYNRKYNELTDVKFSKEVII